MCLLEQCVASTHVHQLYSDDSMDEFLPEVEDDSGDSDFGIKHRKKLKFSVS